MKKMRKLSILLVMLMIMSVISGCGSEKKKEAEFEMTNIVNFNDYADSEEIPDWKGDKVKLVVWGRTNAPNDTNVGKIATDDLVTPEILRITGVEFDKENSFDNGGQSFDSRIAKIIAADDYPDMAYSIPDISGLVEKGVLYRLDELVEKYAPNIYKYFGPSSKVYGDAWNMQMEKFGGVYSLSNSANTFAIRDMTEKDGAYELTPEQLNSAAGVGNTAHGYFYMRDDILKKLYPEAHTVAELEEIFKKNGKFTKEEIFDVPINSPQDFIDMLYDIKEMDLREGKDIVYPVFTHNGSDNWPVLSTFAKVMGYNANYFSYYDLEDKKIKYTYKEDWFKEILKTWNELVRDDVASKEALVDAAGVFQEKLNSGKYIVTLANKPNEAALNGKYHYRKVYVKYTYNKDKFPAFASDDSNQMRISFFNKNLSESQLIQCLRMLDFLASDPGQKLTYWGPKSAGLYTEDENGLLRYTDEELKTTMVKATQDGLALKYNLDAAAWPSYPKVVASKYRPAVHYYEVENYEKVFTPAYYEKDTTVIGKSADIYGTDFTSTIPATKKFWSARQGFESAMVKIFASSNDSEFETNYQSLLDYAQKNGFTDKTLEECNKFYAQTYNAEYMDNLK